MHLIYRLPVSLAFCLLAVCSLPAGAASGFIEANGYHPLKGLFGFPISRLEPLQRNGSAKLLTESEQPQWRFAAQVDHSNIFAGGTSATERLVFDGESTRVNLALDYTASDCLAVGIGVPFVAHHPGSLDQFIENWHDIFNLPDARRDESPQDRLLFDFQAGADRLRLNSSTADLGDLQLQLAVAASCLSELPTSWIAESTVRFGIKLPTGNLSRFSGSESVDAFVDVTSPVFELPFDFRLKASLGLLLIGDVDIFEQLQSRVWFGSAALIWQPQWLKTRGLNLTTQLDYHTAVFDSDLRELGANSVQLGYALQWQWTNRQRVVFGFLEDASIDTSPDFVIHLGFQKYW